MVNDQWSTINGQRSMVNDQWSTINGQRSMVNDQWSTINEPLREQLLIVGDQEGVHAVGRGPFCLSMI